MKNVHRYLFGGKNVHTHLHSTFSKNYFAKLENWLTYYIRDPLAFAVGKPDRNLRWPPYRNWGGHADHGDGGNGRLLE